MPTPLTEVNIHEAKTHLSRLLRRVAAGEEIVIARAGVPVARLVPASNRPKRLFGVDRGRFQVPDDFDAPLPDEILRDFEARESSSTSTSGSGSSASRSHR